MVKERVISACLGCVMNYYSLGDKNHLFHTVLEARILDQGATMGKFLVRAVFLVVPSYGLPWCVHMETEMP